MDIIVQLFSILGQPMPDWDSLRIFLALASTGSSVRAARALQTSHQTVSRRVTQLERDIGARLFDRDTLPWRLTIAGVDLQRRAGPLGEGLDDVFTALRVSSAKSHVPVHLSAASLTLQPLIAPAVRRLQVSHRDIRLRLSVSPIETDIAIGECDMAVRITNSPPPNLIGRELGPVSFGLYGRAEMIAGIDSGSGDKSILIELATPPRHRPTIVEPLLPPALVVDNAEALRDCVAQGLGVGILPDIVGSRLPGCTRSQSWTSPPSDLKAWVIRHQETRSDTQMQAIEQVIAAVARRVFL